MNYIIISFTVSSTTLLLDPLAGASNPPSVEQMILIFSIPMSVLLFTFLGGGHIILDHPSQKRKKFYKVLVIAVVVFALLVSAMDAAYASIVAIFLAAIAVARGGQMITWARRAFSKKSTPEFLDEASPGALLSSGAFLMAVSVFLLMTSIYYNPSFHLFIHNVRIRDRVNCLAAQGGLEEVAAAEMAYFTKHKTFYKDIGSLPGFEYESYLSYYPDTSIKIVKADKESFVTKAFHPGCDVDEDGSPDEFVWDSAKGGLQHGVHLLW